MACASSMNRASISSSASRLFRKMSRHITGSLAAMRVKSRKPEAAKRSTSWRLSSARSSAVPQIVKAIRCGRWRNDPEDPVVMRRLHHLDHGPTAPPQLSNAFHRVRVRPAGGGVSSVHRPSNNVVTPKPQNPKTPKPLCSLI